MADFQNAGKVGGSSVGNAAMPGGPQGTKMPDPGKLALTNPGGAGRASAGEVGKQSNVPDAVMGAGAVAPAGDAAAADARQWPTVLPHANRDQKHAITITKGKAEHGAGKDHVAAVQNSAHVPDIDKPELQDAQKKIVATIAAHRDALPDLLSAKYGGKHMKNSNSVGYMYGGKDGSKNTTKPTEVKAGGTDHAALQKQWVWKELGEEGGASSVNTYDNKDVTFGKGFAAGGELEKMLTKLFAKDPEIKNMFLDAGVTIANSKWQMVNTDLGAIEDDRNALRLFEVNPKLLSIFVAMAEDPKHEQNNLDVQWGQISGAAGKMPDYAQTWAEMPTRLAVHLAHWLPAYSWRSNDYSSTKGDTLAIVKLFVHYMIGGSKHANGALIVPDKWGVVSHLQQFADGAGFAALKAAAKVVTIKKEDLETDKQYDGKLLFPISGESYYVLSP